MVEIMAGHRAVAEAVKSCNPDVISAYPITPQTEIVMDLSKMVADGDLESEFLKVDSEFNAASTCLGASAAGARVFSASNSQGLKLMSEVLYSASGMRLPLVLVIANRSLSAPLSIWSDHTDTFAERDSGVIQIYGEDVQEAMDNVLMAYRVAEDQKICLPAFSCMDGFILTHVYEPVETYEESDVEDFLPPRDPVFTLDPSEPLTMGAYARPEYWTEAKYMIDKAQIKAKKEMANVVEEFADIFGREYGLGYGGTIDTYKTEDADILLISIGSVCGTIKEIVDEYRNKGESIGLAKLRVYRPFPVEELREIVDGVESVAVMEKDISFGYQGGLFINIKSALYPTNIRVPILGFIVGMGGRDVSRGNIRNIVEQTKKAAEEGTHVIDFEDEERWEPLYRDLLPREIDDAGN